MVPSNGYHERGGSVEHGRDAVYQKLLRCAAFSVLSDIILVRNLQAVEEATLFHCNY